MSRSADINPNTSPQQSSPLPPVNWASIGQTAPKSIAIGPRRPDDRLPAADVAILTWTSAEWSALDQVFRGTAVRTADDYEWKKAWFPYTRGAADYTADPESGAPCEGCS